MTDQRPTGAGATATRRWTGRCHLRLLLLLAIAGPFACSASGRHRILTTLFDGVPASEPDSTAVVDTTAAAAAPARADRQPVAWNLHPPFAAKDCDSCHATDPSSGFSGNVALSEPQRELCTICHDEYEREALAARHAWVHGPVAAGECIGCHNPHLSEQQALLRAPAGRGLCLRCHLADELSPVSSADHRSETDCTDCHFPHGGRARAIGPDEA